MPSKNPIVKLLLRYGVRVSRVRPVRQPAFEERIYISSTYAPWKQDQKFLDTVARVQGSTLLDRNDLWVVWQSVEQVSKLEGCLIEVGVWKGGSGALIASRAMQLDITDTVYLCDTFRGIVKTSDADTIFVNGALAEPRTFVENLVEQFPLSNVQILEGIFPEDTAHRITESKIRFCHIDVDVYQSAQDIFNWVWQRLVIGGIVIYDDFADSDTIGVIRHVNETRMRDDLIFVHNLSGQAMFIKIR